VTDSRNLDAAVVEGFGDEWTRFDQSVLGADELRALFDTYFGIFPWSDLPANAAGFDLGSGSGRWARMVAPRVGTLTCIDASGDALAVARRTLAGRDNVRFVHATVGALPLPSASFDFGFSLGVLHHVPDTEAGLRAAVKLLKPGAPFLLYLYYAFDNRPWWFRRVWQASEVGRHFVSRLPHALRYAASQAIAGVVYWPLARAARLLEAAGLRVDSLPLSAYRNRSFYTMRTDALDRFGTQLEQRFTRDEIQAMMTRAGLIEIRFSEHAPYWVACGVASRTATSERG
jgi:SAM-dependent methyltransferase